MILRQPVVGRGLHKAGHLAAGKDKVVAAPFTGRHITGRIFIKLGPVILFEGIVIRREMGGHEVDDGTDAGIVQTVHEFLQFRRGPVPGRGREESRVLVAPAAVKGMLGQGHDLHMGIMVLFDIVDQFIHDVQIMVPAVLILLIALPGTQMQLINIQRPVKVQTPGLHPFVIRELVLIQVPDDGGPVGPQFHAKAVGVAVLDPAQFGIDDILVHLADPGLFDCQFPETVPLRVFHGQFLPVAELADQ